MVAQKSARKVAANVSQVGGALLMLAAAIALCVANSSLAPLYFSALGYTVGGMSVLHWINDGLMAIFFLVVGLEIKREFLQGELSTPTQRVLPGVAAIGGMIGPALVYLAMNRGPSGELAGWAIPAATDIAFALGVLALLGDRVPASLRVFVAALAIIDDLGAVMIIAVFYTADIHPGASLAALTVVIGLIALNVLHVRQLTLYIVLGVALWFFVLKSGVHATIAGVVTALVIPLRHSSAAAPPPLVRMEHATLPWVALLIVPLFGFANAGVSFAEVSVEALTSPVPVGVALGLFVGKQLGIMLSTAAVVRLGWGALPANSSWLHLYGVSLLCGIGFTMSLFIGFLAFPGDEALQAGVKMGVLIGSTASALAAAAVLLSAKGSGTLAGSPTRVA